MDSTKVPFQFVDNFIYVGTFSDKTDGMYKIYDIPSGVYNIDLQSYVESQICYTIVDLLYKYNKEDFEKYYYHGEGKEKILQYFLHNMYNCAVNTKQDISLILTDGSTVLTTYEEIESTAKDILATVISILNDLPVQNKELETWLRPIFPEDFSMDTFKNRLNSYGSAYLIHKKLQALKGEING